LGFGYGPDMVLYLASDLLWATRIKGTADGIGIPARPVRNIEMLRARRADSDVRALILDLESPEMALEMLAEVRKPDGAASASSGRLRVVAFGPHVNVELLERARAGGADRVMTRGAFDARLVELLKELEA
jgi:hypothetical protein